jgi:hypothetical protein
MTAFDNKEKAEENKYAHDKEVEFKINAKYHGLLAIWMAGAIKLDAEGADKYKNMLVTAGLGKNDPEALFNKIKQEFQEYKIPIDEHQLREEMYNILQKAKKQVLGS